MAYKSAIVGYGGMGRDHHFEQINNLITEVEVIGAYDVRPERLDVAKEDGLNTYASYNEMLADDKVDIVVVATPNNFHKDLAVAALMAGKNVICEKPVTMNASELEEIIEARDKSGKQFAVHQNRRWDRNFLMAKEAVNSGVLGNPFYIEHRVQGSGGELHGWRGSKENGGGMLFDWGVHFLDQIMWMIDSKVVDVYAQMFKIKSDECDDNIKLNLMFENGASALIQVDTYSFITEPLWYVSGDKATMVIDDWECNGKIVRASKQKIEWTENIVYTAIGPTRTMAPRSKETIEELPLPDVGPDSDWVAYYRNYAAALDGTEELIVKPEQSLRVMQVIDAGFKSWEEKRSISVSI